MESPCEIISPPAALPSRRPFARARNTLLLALLALPVGPLLGQTTISESFKNTTASGWTFGGSSGSTAPYLTANTIDTPGNGWLRLTESEENQATFALFDTQLFSVNAKIQIEIEYAFYNGGNIGSDGFPFDANAVGDGITFFLVDGSVNSSSFQAGGYGGSLGYANINSTPGMAGGYLGFGFDNFGNYAAANEGKAGGITLTGPHVSDGLSTGEREGGYANTIGVRGPADSNFEYIASSGPLQDLPDGGQMYIDSTTRPDQTGDDFRSFRLTLDANNQLLVEMKFGTSGDYITAFTADLSTYDRPETFKIGFTAGTGGAYSIHEVRNVAVTTTPWSIGEGAYEWDNGAGTTTWGATPGGANTNWHSSVTADDNLTPVAGADVLFGNKPTDNGPDNKQQVTLGSDVNVRNLTFDSAINYTIGTVGDGRTLSFGDTTQAGLPSINVNDYNGAHARHKINSDILLVERIAIQNFSASILCLNGEFDTAGHKITVNGTGAVNFNGDIIGSGDLVKNGLGITTINNDNAATWTGDIVVNGGQLVVTADGALGSAGTPGTPGSPGVFQGATTQQWDVNSNVLQLNEADIPPGGIFVGMTVTGPGIPPGTTITAITTPWAGMRFITLSQNSTGSTWDNSINDWGTVNYYSVNPVAAVPSIAGTTINDGGTLTLRGGVNYATQEATTLSGRGTHLGDEIAIGAIYNDGGDNTFAGPIALAAASAIGSRDGTLTLSGAISGSHSLAKLGEGAVSLTGTNTYTGNTIIEAGVLRVTTASLPGGYDTTNTGNDYGAIELAGGVLELASNTTFTRSIGTGEEQIFWSGDGGFSAFGGDRTVTLAGGAVTWGSGGFVGDGHALLLSSDYADGTLIFTNTINLGGTSETLREIRVANGSAEVDGRLNAINGAAGIHKTGEGTLLLNSNNGYTGATRISGGALRITNTDRIDGTNLQLSGGVLEVGTTFSRSLGSGADQVQWLGDGGFSAVSSARSITLGSGTRTWGETHFVGLDNRLIFGSVSANNTASLQNALALGNDSGTRTIHTIRGTSSTVADGTLVGVVSGSANLAVTGNGRLDFTAANINSGAVTITGAEVRLSGANGAMTSAAGFTVRQGGTLTLDNSGTNNTNRIGNDADITLAGGTLSLLPRNSNNSNLNENIGRLVLSAGDNTVNITVNNTQTNTRNRLSADELARSSGATVNFTTNAANADGFGTNIGSYRPAVTFDTAPTPESGILAFATVNGTAFAGYGTNGIVAVAGTDTAQGSWTSSTIAANTADQVLDGNHTVGALSLGSGIDVTEDTTPRTLTVQTGGILSTGATVSNISTSVLRVGGTGNRELITHVYGDGGLNISSSIQNNSNTTGLTKSGDGTLTLSGTTANTFTGATTVNAGTLVLAKSDGVTALSSTSITVGDGRGIDTLRLNANEQINNAANVTLRGGEVGNSTNVARLELNGATDESYGSRVESFASLHIEGNTVLDFGGGTPCSPTFLYLESLTVAANSLLTITNWIEFTDFLLVKKVDFDESAYSRVIFEGYGGSASWKSYDSDYYQIIPYSPVPEPASFGLLSLGGLTAFSLLRRRRRRAA